MTHTPIEKVLRPRENEWKVRLVFAVQGLGKTCLLREHIGFFPSKSGKRDSTRPSRKKFFQNDIPTVDRLYCHNVLKVDKTPKFRTESDKEMDPIQKDLSKGQYTIVIIQDNASGKIIPDSFVE